MESDLALFNFDGTDLDSGTVAEYMYAKTLDIPAVILRTDFRHGGDQEPEGNPGNIMVSFYPRTQVLHVDARQRYAEALPEGGDPQEVSSRIQQRIASEVIDLLDVVRGESPVLGGGRKGAEDTYRWGLQLAGGSLPTFVPHSSHVSRIVDRKIEKGLLYAD